MTLYSNGFTQSVSDNSSVNTFEHATMEAVFQWTNIIIRC
jgi:hypothetical protein